MSRKLFNFYGECKTVRAYLARARMVIYPSGSREPRAPLAYIVKSYARAVVPCHTSHRCETYEEIGASPCLSIAGNAGDNIGHGTTTTVFSLKRLAWRERRHDKRSFSHRSSTRSTIKFAS